MKILDNYALGGWVQPGKNLNDIHSAVTGEVVAQTGSDGLDFGEMTRYARETGGPALRAMTFHQRAVMLKGLAKAIVAGKEALYELSYDTGARQSDSWIDIEGGTGTLFTYASVGRRQMPNDTVLVDGGAEPLSKQGSFIGQHVFTSRHGVALHINAFNFPVWGMLEKLGPTLLAGVPAIVKPARATAPLCEAAVRIMIETGPAARWGAAIGGWRRRGHFRSSELPGYGVLYRFRRNRHTVAKPSGGGQGRGAVYRRARQLERRHPRPRCGGRHAGIRPVRQRGGAAK